MKLNLFALSVLLGISAALPGTNGTYTTSTSPPTPTSTQGGDCGDKCGGVCGDGIVQYPEEQCDLGPKLNGAWGSGCDENCQTCSYCGDGVVDSELGEEVSVSSFVYCCHLISV